MGKGARLAAGQQHQQKTEGDGFLIPIMKRWNIQTPPPDKPRSSRREEALTCFARKTMSLLTSAVTVQGFNARNSSSGNSHPALSSDGGEGGHRPGEGVTSTGCHFETL